MKSLPHFEKFLSTVVTLILGSMLLVQFPVSADELQSSITRGGRLYDNWYEETREQVPTQKHPAYPTDRTYAADPKASWRCKECHGWDYRGRDGAYGKGKHATGIKGINAMAGADIGKIMTILKDSTHAYGELMADEDFRDLANFVSQGQIDMNRFVDVKSKISKGNKSIRQDYYQSICAGCHGRNGDALKTIPPLGDIARDNPWEALHKILNGHPSEQMPALRVLDHQVLADILAYVQTLSIGEIIISIVRGGRLYDNWRKEIDAPVVTGSRPDYAPDKKHPAYPITGKFAKSPVTNWRCAECHGWDYQGRAGSFSKGVHFTGIKGIRNIAGTGTATIISVLKNDKHRYGKILSFQDLRDLANFVSKGQVNMSKYIDPGSGTFKGDKIKHQAHYATICASCHGIDGAKIITISPLGRIIQDNPWKALHVIINGHPGEVMPALRPLGVETLANILAYVQTLPRKR